MLVCLHDYTSPAAAVAVFRLQRLADTGLDVRFEGFDVRGVDAALPVELGLLAELERWRDDAAAMGLALRRPRQVPPTVRAHVAAAVAESAGLGAAWREACYRAFWEDGADLGDLAVLRRLAEVSGCDPERVIAAASDRGRVAAFRRRSARRRREGVGGVPILDASGTLVPATLPDATLRSLAEL